MQPAPWWSDGAARGHGGGAEKRRDWDDVTCYGCRRRGHPVHLCPEAAQERREEQWHGDQVERAHGEALEEDLHPEMQGCVWSGLEHGGMVQEAYIGAGEGHWTRCFFF